MGKTSLPGSEDAVPGPVDQGAHGGAPPPRKLPVKMELKESQARNLAIMSALPDFIFINSRDGEFLDYHAPDPRQLLLPPEQFLGRKTRDIFPPNLADSFMDAYGKAIDQGQVQVLEYALDKDGETRHFEARVVAMDAERVLSIIRDITERKRFEQKLSEEEARFRELASLLPETAYETDISGRITFLNEAGMRTFGLGPSDLAQGVNILALLAPQNRDALRRVRAKLLNTAAEVKLESHGISRDGTQLPIIIHANAIVREDQSHGTRGVIMDISERKQAEQALADTKAMLEAAFDQSPSAMVLVSIPDRVLRVINPPCLELLGALDQVCPIGQPITDLEFSWKEFTADGKPIGHDESPLALAIKGVKTFAREVRIQRKDGSERLAMVHGTPVYNAYGQHIAAMVVLRDITESRRPSRS